VTGIVGTGVGLNLVKMVVDLHGGEVTVETQEGKGSLFTVRLPTTPALSDEVGSAAADTAAKRAKAEAAEENEATTTADPSRSAPADPLGA
jgi:hypothetical protein